MGRLTKDPELRRTGSGVAVTSFTVAVDRDIANKESGEKETDFIDCVAWRGTGEFVDKYFSKGNRIGITGEWRTGSYTNKDGQKVYTNDCVVSTAEFVESKKESAPAQNDDFMNIEGEIDEQIPFV
jgi:single-strand DNA-binding protein